MKKFMYRFPVISELILFVAALVCASVFYCLLQGMISNADTCNAAARLITGIILFVIFIKYFRTDKSFKGFIIMLPALLLALYKIPYYFISDPADPCSITGQYFILALAPAVFEEVLFREVFITNLRKRYQNKYAVVIISALVFSLVHLIVVAGADGISVLVQLVFAFVTGLVFGAVYLRTEDLISVMIAHFMIDFLGHVFPAGTDTPVWFITVFAVIMIFEAVYAMILTARMIPEGDSKES